MNSTKGPDDHQVLVISYLGANAKAAGCSPKLGLLKGFKSVIPSGLHISLSDKFIHSLYSYCVRYLRHQLMVICLINAMIFVVGTCAAHCKGLFNQFNYL